MDTSNRIREHRERFGWSQGELARRVGTSTARISQIENQRSQPTIRVAQRIAAALYTTTDMLWPVEKP